MRAIVHKWLESTGSRLEFDLPYFARSSFWVLVRQAVSAVTGLLLSILFARLMSQETLGQYQLILAVLVLVSIFSIPGLNTAVTKAAACGYDGDYRKAVKISFLWSLLGIPTLLVIGGAYYLMGDTLVGISLMVSSVLFPFFYAPNTWDSFLQGKGRFDTVAKYSLIQSVLNAIVTISVVIFSQSNLISLTCSYVLTSALLNSYFYRTSLRYVQNQRSDNNTIPNGWFFTKINLLGLIADNADKLIIGVMLSPSALAAYYILSIIPLRIKDFLKPFFNVLYPKFSSIDKDLPWVDLRNKKVLFGILVVLLAFLCGVYALAIVPLNQILFGDQYTEYYRYSGYYTILLFALPFLLMVIRYSQMKQYNRAILLSDTGYSASRIILSIVFIYFFGVLGAVIAYNLSVFIWLVLYLYFVYRKYQER